MAVVTTKKADSKYSHLKNVYDKQITKVKSSKKAGKIEFKKEEILIPRSHVIRSVVLFLLVLILSTAGYILARITK